MGYHYYQDTPLALVNGAIDYAHRFLGNEHGATDSPTNRLELLGRGWASLAAAIQILDSSEEQFELLKEKVSGANHYPYWALRRLAHTCHEGAVKYAEENWHRGFQVKDLLNHGIHHMIRWSNGFGLQQWGEPDKDCITDLWGEPVVVEDELGHSMWSFMAAVHTMIFKSDMQQFLLGQNYSITPELRKMHDEHASRRRAS